MKINSKDVLNVVYNDNKTNKENLLSNDYHLSAQDILAEDWEI